MKTKLFTLSVVLSLVVTAFFGQEKNPWDREVFFGEQHLHSQNSPDAFAMGTRNTPDDAYNFAKGIAVKKIVTGKMIQKKTAYDWAALTDHSEYLGIMPLLLDPSSPLQKTEIGKMIASGDPKQGAAAFQLIITSAAVGKPISYLNSPEYKGKAWQDQKDAANRHYEPGVFTTFIAYEWSSQPMSQNLHHNVFFRDSVGADAVFSAFESVKREDLWTYQEVQRDMGHENFSIPHNPNVSNSTMFPTTTSYGTPIDKKWAERYNANSPGVEILQTKGQSETHPALSPNDEFASFEIGFKHLLGAGGVVGKIDHSYVRRALTDGIGYQEKIGANPYKFGIVAGADSHDAASDNEENNYTGVHGNTDMTPKIRLATLSAVAGEAPIAFGTPGATGVWADENTREGIFDAIKRKETYGTSGPLIRVRLFAGWNFTDADVSADDWVERGYKNGVPMGSDMTAMPASAKAPTFMIWAMKDPESGNLDRIQIIKGYYHDGHPRETVYDVVWSDADDRKVDSKTGKVPSVGNTVNVKNASYTNKIGDTQLSAVWTDPDFDKSEPVVYYVRVIEIPTPRWSTYDCKELGIDVPEGVPTSLQERAFSSPVWYTPDPSVAREKRSYYPGLEIIIE